MSSAQPKSVKIFSALILGAFLLLLVTTNYAKSAGTAFECAPCPKNSYCVNGTEHSCPPNRPATAGTGAGYDSDCTTCPKISTKTPVFGKTEDGKLDCVTCYQSSAETGKPVHTWNGSACQTCAATNSDKPVYDGESCVSCETKVGHNEVTWDGNSCVQCKASEGKEWNSTIGTCGCKEGYYTKEQLNKDGVIITNENGRYLFTLTKEMILQPTAITYQECLDMMKARNEFGYKKYPELICHNHDSNGKDYLSGGIIACRNQNKRIANNDELTYIARELYNAEINKNDWTTEIKVANNSLWTIMQNLVIWTNSNTQMRVFNETQTINDYSPNYATDVKVICIDL